MLVEVEHVKAHRTKWQIQQMSWFEKFSTEGNEKEDEVAKEGAMMDGRDMARVRAVALQQERGESLCSIAVCS